MITLLPPLSYSVSVPFAFLLPYGINWEENTTVHPIEKQWRYTYETKKVLESQENK